MTTTAPAPDARTDLATPPRRGDWIWVAAAFGLTGISQLVAQLAIGRVLGPADYGQVATLANLMNLAGIPLVAVQLTVTGLVARGGSARPTLVRFAAGGLAVGAVAFLAAPVWSGGFALTSIAACRVAALFVPATFVLAVARGNAVGLAQSRRLAVAMSIASIVRVVAGLAGAQWFGIAGAAAGAVLAELTLAVVLVIAVRPTGRAVGSIVATETWGATYTQVAMWLVVNVDLLWARRLLSGPDAGRYLAASSVAVGLVSLGQAFLWHHASSSTEAEAGPAIVRRAAAIVAAAALVGVPAAAVALPVLLGSRFGSLTPLLVLGGLWAVLASVVQTGTATQLIAGRQGLTRLLPVAVLAIAAPPLWIAALGDRPVVLYLASLVSTAVGAAVVLLPRPQGAVA